MQAFKQYKMNYQYINTCCIHEVTNTTVNVLMHSSHNSCLWDTEYHVDLNRPSNLFIYIWFPTSVYSSSVRIVSKLPVQPLKKEYSYTKQQ